MTDRVGRRTALKAVLGFGLGVSCVPTCAAAQAPPAADKPREGDLLVKSDDASKTPLTPQSIVAGAKPLLAWAMDPTDGTLRSSSRLNELLVMRLDPAKLTPETRLRATDGVLAYTAICTHNGCDVDDWLPDEQMLACSCHDSRFDPKDGAKVMDGPAPRPLPALPLKIVDGRLVVAGPFTARVGFEP